MSRKRKVQHGAGVSKRAEATSHYAPEEMFNDSEDEFFASRDKILLENGPMRKKQRKVDEAELYLEPSDEEVLAHEGKDDPDLESARASEDETEDGDWGATKADYYDADVIETEADALEEEKEARRLQQKQIQAMTEADFGFNESHWLGEEDARAITTVTETLPDIQVSPDMPVEEKVEILQTRYPEFGPLAKDFAELQEIYDELRLASHAAQVVQKSVTPVATVKFRAVAAYIGAIAMYFALLTTPQISKPEQISAMSAKELREHPVMSSLFKCRKLWDRVKNVKIPELEEVQLQEVEERIIANSEVLPQKKPRKQRKTKVVEEVEEIPKGRKRVKKEDDLAKFLTLAMKQDEDSDFGDETPLTAQEAAEKARKKKSLRFYTSQIAQKSSKRGAASRDAGGDDDVPHKERLRDKQARLMKEAEKRGREAPDTMGELDGESASDVSNEYYDMVAARSKQKKARRKAEAEAAREGGEVYVEEEVGPDGKRAITYAIAKNKGLMPRRKKEVRNPRVKKRKKFEEKKKKLSSVRAVYKGGEGRGGYGGELTGIKSNLVKSVKL